MAGAGARDTTDGRVLRSERSRDAIAAAKLEMVGEGDLEPTAQQVAARARVGIRTVFRLFADMETLYASVDARLLAEVRPLLEAGPPAGAGLTRRADGLVAERAKLFERIGPYKRAANLRRHASPFLTRQHKKLAAELRERLRIWLPELADADDALVEALDLATSFEAWDRLRSDQRLGRARATAAAQRTVRALVAEL